MQNILSYEIESTLSILEKRLFEDKWCNDHYYYEQKRWEMLKRRSWYYSSYLKQYSCL